MAAEDADAAAEEVDFLVEKDLYKILGVPKGAKPDDIKKAYRKLSLKHHPDKNQGDPDAKAKFQKIAEAFAVLSDSQKRLKYDKSGDMDLEDFDMDQFMNMWVGEMMEDGGVVDDMMREVLPWADDEDKMRQFMEENVKTEGKKLVCKLCGKEVSNKRLMLAHFEQKHKWECEDWANETVKSMKASFESFMKQITGIGDDSGTFILPDGTTAEMSKVKGVPDIRQHMQSRVDKAKEAEAVMDMYRKVAGSPPDEGAGQASAEDAVPADSSEVQATLEYVPDPKEIARVLHVEADEAEQLAGDREALLEKLRQRIDKINQEEDEDMELLESMGGMDGLAGMGGMGDLAGLEGLLGGAGAGGRLDGLLGGMTGGPGCPGGGLGGLEGLLGSLGLDGEDPEAIEALLGELGGMPGMSGGFPSGFAGLGSFGGLGSLGGGSRGSRQPPPRDPEPTMEIGCVCGYTCGTMKALERHLEKFKGDPAHAPRIVELKPSSAQRACDAGGYPGGGLSGGSAARRAPVAPASEETEIAFECICGFTCGTANALQRHLNRFIGDPNHARKC